MSNVGKYTIHGCYGMGEPPPWNGGVGQPVEIVTPGGRPENDTFVEASSISSRHGREAKSSLIPDPRKTEPPR